MSSIIERILDEHIVKCQAYKQKITIYPKDVELLSKLFPYCFKKLENGNYWYKGQELILLEDK